MPRLVCFADYGGSYSGSFMPMLVALGKQARDQGWSVEVVLSPLARDQPWLDNLTSESITYTILDVTRVGLKRWGAWLTEEALRGRWQASLTRSVSDLLAESQAPTIVHTHFDSFDVSVAHAAQAHPQTMVIWHEHTLRPSGPKATLGAILWFRLFGRTVDRFLCVGPSLTNSVTRMVNADRVQLVPNGIDTERFSLVTPLESAEARRQLGISNDCHVLLHFGSYWDGKGGDHFLSCVRTLRGQAEEANVLGLTVGGQDARNAVAAAGMASTVVVLEPREDIRSIYAAGDVLVAPSKAEGDPLAVLEALASGVPVVASNIPAHAGLSCAVAACRLAACDGESLAASVREVLGRDSATSATETRLARRWVVEHRGLATWTKTVIGTYEELLRKAEPAVGSRRIAPLR